jgi:hypothetical protein
VVERFRAKVYGCSLAGIAGLSFTRGMVVCRSLCDEPILRPEESYRLCVCDLGTSRMRWPWPALDCCARERKESYLLVWNVFIF